MTEYHEIETREPVVTYEILAGVERVGQPTPDLNPRGAGCCFACSTAAIIQHFARRAGKTPPTLEQVYSVWAGDYVKAPGGSDFWATERFWGCWQGALKWYDLAFEMEQDPPIEIPDRHYMNHPFGVNLYSHSALKKRIQTRLEAGWLIHVEMQSEPQRERAKAGHSPFGSDHLVVIDGFRETVTHGHCCAGPGYDAHWGGVRDYWLHVVDSSRKKPEPYWMKLSDWKDNHGGYCMWFVRPERRLDLDLPTPRPCPLGHRSPITKLGEDAAEGLAAEIDREILGEMLATEAKPSP